MEESSRKHTPSPPPPTLRSPDPCDPVGHVYSSSTEPPSTSLSDDPQLQLLSALESPIDAIHCPNFHGHTLAHEKGTADRNNQFQSTATDRKYSVSSDTELSPARYYKMELDGRQSPTIISNQINSVHGELKWLKESGRVASDTGPRENRLCSSKSPLDGTSEASSPPSTAATQAPFVAENGFFSFIHSYLIRELQSTSDGGDHDVTSSLIKRERVSNFLNVPLEVERLMVYGYFICLDAFLNVFAILPLRLYAALKTVLWRFLTNGRSSKLTATQKCDLLKAFLILLCCYCLQYIDASKLYHSIRGQAVIKLYVIFNVLEIGDRLCCSFGQDILDSLFSKTVDASANQKRDPLSKERSMAKTLHQLAPISYFFISLCYVIGHTLVLFYQMVTLNVAINSHNNALLTLLISNQFVEIKGSVFKKFEKENLFQLACSDMVERFQVSIFLIIITARNLIELAPEQWSLIEYLYSRISELYTFVVDPASQSAVMDYLWSLMKFPLDSLVSLPSQLIHLVMHDLPHHIYIIISQPFAFTMDISNYVSLFDALIYPVIIVMGSEILVDWLKHAFITKFNQIRPTVYSKYLDVLCKDYLKGWIQQRDPNNHILYDQSTAVARRIGFASLPLVCLLIRVTMASSIFRTTFKAPDFSLIHDMIINAKDFTILSDLYELAKPSLLYSLAFILMYSLLVICKCFVGYMLLLYSSRRTTHLRALKMLKDKPVARQVAQHAPPVSPKKPPIFYPNSLNRIAQSVPVSPAHSYLHGTSTSTILERSPFYKDTSSVLLSHVYGSDPMDSTSSLPGLPIGDSKSRTSEESFKMPDEGEQNLKKEEKEIIGQYKMEHPDGNVTLDNIDRYTLFKSRIP